MHLSCGVFVAFVATLSHATAARIDDWLVTRIQTPAIVLPTVNSGLVLQNGLVNRTFTVLGSGIATTDLWSAWSSSSVLRSVQPEAVIELDGTVYSVGGLSQLATDFSGQPHAFAYLNRSGLVLRPDPSAFQFVGHDVGPAQAPYPWTPGRRGSDPKTPWPPAGARLRLNFTAPASVAVPSHAAVRVAVVYELYEGTPILSKWVEVWLDPAAAAGGTAHSAAVQQEGGTAPFPLSHGFVPGTVELTGLVVESLGVNHDWAPLVANPFRQAGQASTGGWAPPGVLPGGQDQNGTYWTGRLHVEASEPHVASLAWLDGPQTTGDITTGTPGAMQPLLNATYTSGPGFMLVPPAVASRRARFHSPRSPPAVFASFRVLELVADTTDKQRWGLSRRRLLRLLAPAATESPTYLSMTNVSDAGVAEAARQAAAVGFDMLVYSFGTGFDWESTSPAYLAALARQVASATALGVEVGGYDLICLDRGNGGYGGNVGDQWDVVEAGSGALGPDACFASGWPDRLLQLSDGIVAATNMTALITDGPYGGSPDHCASTNHSHHLGASDSVYWQTRTQIDFFAAMLERGVYIMQPDSYEYAGAQRTPMGYNEQTWSLPRRTQMLVSRALLHESLYHYIPTQVWSFIPITQYHSGGDAATFEPLSVNIADYEHVLVQTLALGVGGNFRGDRLFDSPAVQAVVAKWAGFYRTYRDIVTADVVHLRRPDGQGWDGMMHVGPLLQSGRRALAVLFNPTGADITQAIELPLYYTGLADEAVVSVGETGTPATLILARDYSVAVPLTIPANGFSWVHVAAPGSRAHAEMRRRAGAA